MKRTLLASAGLFLIVLLLYSRLASFDFIWDDDKHIQANPHLGTAQGLTEIWLKPGATSQYYPLTFTVFWAMNRMFGLNPSMFHLLNMLLHATNAVLIFIILRRLKFAAAFWAALIFAIHPVQVETVVWALELKNLLSTCFYLLAFLFYERYIDAGGKKNYYFALTAFLCALLSKTVSATFPLAVIVFLWWRNGKVNWKDLKALVPFFLMALFLGKITASLEMYRIGAVGPEWNFDFWERCWIAGRAFWFYIGKLVAPVRLMFIYPRWDVKAVGNEWGYFLSAAAVGLLAALYRLKEKIGRGPLACVLFFIVTLLPALGFLNFYPMRFSFVADHFQYLASVGIIVPIAGTVPFLWGQSRVVRWFGRMCLIVWMALLTAATSLYLPAFRNQMTLWTDTIQKNPICWLAYANRGVLWKWQGRTDLALWDYHHALALIDDADIYYNRANAYLGIGDYEKAIDDLSQAIRLYPRQADYYNNRGLAYLSIDKNEAALADFRTAIRLNPRHGFAWANMGKAFLFTKCPEKALKALDQAIQCGATYDEVYEFRKRALSAISEPKDQQKMYE
jgi:protein O-mannosyl-transferase